MPKSTYYHWLRRQTEVRLQDKKGGSPLPWNKLRPEERAKILSRARTSLELSARQLALKLVDMDDYSRFILAWELKSDMAAGPLIDVVQQAVDLPGMTDVPGEDREVKSKTLLLRKDYNRVAREQGNFL
jgi:hypothetical protein